MNEKQSKFCQEYQKDSDASKAARRAGYSKKTSGQTGYDLLQRADVKLELARLGEARIKKTEITLERLDAECAKYAFRKKKKVSDTNALKALDMLNKRRGGYLERVELTGAEGGPVKIDAEVRVAGAAELMELLKAELTEDKR